MAFLLLPIIGITGVGHHTWPSWFLPLRNVWGICICKLATIYICIASLHIQIQQTSPVLEFQEAAIPLKVMDRAFSASRSFPMLRQARLTRHGEPAASIPAQFLRLGRTPSKSPRINEQVTRSWEAGVGGGGRLWTLLQADLSLQLTARTLHLQVFKEGGEPQRELGSREMNSWGCKDKGKGPGGCQRSSETPVGWAALPGSGRCPGPSTTGSGYLASGSSSDSASSFSPSDDSSVSSSWVASSSAPQRRKPSAACLLSPLAIAPVPAGVRATHAARARCSPSDCTLPGPARLLGFPARRAGAPQAFK